LTVSFSSPQNRISWDTSTVTAPVMRYQDSITAGTYYETITVTDNLGAVTTLPLTFKVTQADTLTISMDTGTVVIYNGSPINIYPKAVFKGLVGSDTLTVTTKFSSTNYALTTSPPTNADTYTVIAADPVFTTGGSSNYVNIVYETSTAVINKAKQKPLNIALYGAVVGSPYLIYLQGGSGDGSVNESLTAFSNNTNCSLSNHYLSLSSQIQSACEIYVVKAASQNYLSESQTTLVYFMKYDINQPSGLVGSGTTIALNGKTTLTIDDTVTAVAPMITGFTLVGSTLTISGYGFGSVPVTVQFYRYVNVSPSPTPYNSGQNIQVAVPSGASTGPVIVITATGMAATDEVTIP
jgi:hypothetical protein